MHELDKSIYISGPISNKGKYTDEEIIRNVQNGEEIYGALIEKGYAPFCPHLSYYPDLRWTTNGIRKIDHATYMRIDKQWVGKCKYFFYMLPEVYGESHGARMELAWAKDLGKRIFTDLKDVPSRHEVVL